MKKVLLGALIALTSVLVYKSCTDYNSEQAALKESSLLIQQELKNVSKLIVTEGHFVEVYNYADSKELFGSLVTADKKALVVANAEVTIAYDLSQIEYDVDEEHTTIRITKIPEPEIKIHPEFEYYDVTADYFNPFNADDYNAIRDNVNASLEKKIDASTLRSNAENRLVSELSRIYVLTNSLGWKLVVDGKRMDDMNVLNLDGNTFID
ncbi:MAG: DUF4230 domain-containing protein [Bacteroidota bacterium]